MRARDDTELVAAVQAGDSASYGELYERYESKLYNYAYRIAGNPDDARDVAQDAFVKVFEALPGMAGRDVDFGRYLYRTAHNLAIDVVRGRGRHAADDGPLEHSEDGSVYADPERTVLLEEQQHKVLAAMFGLPEQHRAVLALRELNGMSYSDIGHVLDMSPSNVGVTLMRARLKLKGAVRMSYVDADKLAAECRQMLPKLSALIDGELSAAERERVERHLDDCPLCRLALEEMTEASKSYRALIPLLPPLAMRREVLHRFVPHGDVLEADLESLRRPRTVAERWQRLPLAGKVALGVGAASAVGAVGLVLLMGARLADAFRSPASNAGTAVESVPTAPPPSAVASETTATTGAVEATAGGERGGETDGEGRASSERRDVAPRQGSEPVTLGNDASELDEPAYEDSGAPVPDEQTDPEYEGPPPSVVLPPRDVMPSPSPSTAGPD